MTQNKFWLVCELNTSDMIFDSEAEAVKKAYNESKDNEYADFYVVEAKWHYKSKSVTVNKVIETQLHEKQSVPVETSFEATPEESLAVEPRFKIGDRVLLDNYYECVVDDYFDETKSYKLSLLGGGYNIAKETRVTKK